MDTWDNTWGVFKNHLPFRVEVMKKNYEVPVQEELKKKKSVKLRHLKGSVGPIWLCWEEAGIRCLDSQLMKHVLIKKSAFSSLSWEKFVLVHLVNTAPSVPS